MDKDSKGVRLHLAFDHGLLPKRGRFFKYFLRNGGENTHMIRRLAAYLGCLIVIDAT